VENRRPLSSSLGPKSVEKVEVLRIIGKGQPEGHTAPHDSKLFQPAAARLVINSVRLLALPDELLRDVVRTGDPHRAAAGRTLASLVGRRRRCCRSGCTPCVVRMTVSSGGRRCNDVKRSDSSLAFSTGERTNKKRFETFLLILIQQFFEARKNRLNVIDPLPESFKHFLLRLKTTDRSKPPFGRTSAK
jgi:hypothetical protein